MTFCQQHQSLHSNPCEYQIRMSQAKAQPSDSAQGVDKKVCRKVQGKSEPGNSCLQTPGTCESCPKWINKSSRARLMNKTETRYAQMLEGMRLAGEIVSYQYEAITLKLGPDCRYTPDFLVIKREHEWTAVGEDCLRFEFHEVKGGYAREDSLVKIRAASQQFPHFTFKLCRYSRGEWSIKEIA